MTNYKLNQPKYWPGCPQFQQPEPSTDNYSNQTQSSLKLEVRLANMKKDMVQELTKMQ